MIVKLALLVTISCFSCVLSRSCQLTQKSLAKKGSCPKEESSMVCRGICNGDIYDDINNCPLHCCVKNKKCLMKVLTKSDNKTFGIESRSNNLVNCLQQFPFNCELSPHAMTIEYLQPEINIPYCHRIPCRETNPNLNFDEASCLSTPGCAFDSSLLFYRLVYGNAVMPTVPVCHLAIRSKVFINAAVDFVSKYNLPSLIPMLTKCLIKTKIVEIFTNPPGCEMVLMLEFLKNKAKSAGWKNITGPECHFIGACWLSGRCLHPVNKTGQFVVPSAHDMLPPGAPTMFGEAECVRLSPRENLADAYHACMKSGCSMNVDEGLLQSSMIQSAKQRLHSSVLDKVGCMVKTGDARPA